MTIRPLTDDGPSVYASISPNGRLLAYVRRDGERSLRVKRWPRVARPLSCRPKPIFLGSAPTFTPDGWQALLHRFRMNRRPSGPLSCLKLLQIAIVPATDSVQAKFCYRQGTLNF